MRHLILAVIATCLLGLPQMAQQQRNKADAVKPNSKADTKPVPPIHVVVEEPLPSIRTEPKSNDAAEKQLPRFLTPEWGIVDVTALYTIIAGLTLWAIKRQADLLKQQVEDARQAGAQAATLAKETLEAIQEQATQMAQQVQIMERQIGIAETSITIAKDSLNAQKPFIQVAAIQFQRGKMLLADNIPVSEIDSVVVLVKNHGFTRAISTTPKGTLSISPGDKFTVLPGTTSIDLASGIDLGIAFDPFNTWLDAASITLLKERRVSLHVNLTIAYADVSRQSHETEIEATLADWIQRKWDSKIRST